MATIEGRVFWLISRAAIVAYRTFPIFGALRGSVALIRNGDKILVLERNDGLGLGLPGGLLRRRESEEQGLAREVFEETGLRVTSASLLFHTRGDWPYPNRIAVFAAEAAGQIRGSWEGTPYWIRPSDAQPRIMANQREILNKWLELPSERGER